MSSVHHHCLHPQIHVDLLFYFCIAKSYQRKIAMKHPGLPVLPESRSTEWDRSEYQTLLKSQDPFFCERWHGNLKCKQDELGGILLEVVMGNWVERGSSTLGQNHLEDLLKLRFLGANPRVYEWVALGRAQEFLFLTSSQCYWCWGWGTTAEACALRLHFYVTCLESEQMCQCLAMAVASPLPQMPVVWNVRWSRQSLVHLPAVAASPGAF